MTSAQASKKPTIVGLLPLKKFTVLHLANIPSLDSLNKKLTIPDVEVSVPQSSPNSKINGNFLSVGWSLDLVPTTRTCPFVQA